MSHFKSYSDRGLVTVDPKALRSLKPDPAHPREIRQYMMNGQQASDYSMRISPLARRYEENIDDQDVFDLVEAMHSDEHDINHLYMEGKNARIIQIDGITRVEEDFDRGFKTEERYFDVLDGSAHLLKRSCFAKDKKGEPYASVEEIYGANAALVKKVTRDEFKCVAKRFDNETEKLIWDSITVFGENQNHIISHVYKNDEIVERHQYRQHIYADNSFAVTIPYDSKTHKAHEYFVGSGTEKQCVSDQEYKLYQTLGDMALVTESLAQQTAINAPKKESWWKNLGSKILNGFN